MMKTIRNIFLTLALLGCFSCSQNLYDMSDYPEGKKADARFIPYKYEHKLNPGDQLSISIWDHPELSVGSVYEPTSLDSKLGKWVDIGADGFAVLPMIGKVNLGGKTIKEAETILTEVYGHYIESPHLSLKVINMEITITGEVNKPGVYTVERQSITLPKLLGLSGGLTKYAKTSAIQIIRGNPQNPHIILADLKTLGGMVSSPLQIYPEDIIHVPAKKGKKLDQTAQKLVPLVGILSAMAIIFSTTN